MNEVPHSKARSMLRPRGLSGNASVRQAIQPRKRDEMKKPGREVAGRSKTLYLTPGDQRVS